MLNSKTIYFVFGFAIIVFNYIDAYLTIHYISNQIAEESNPIMTALLSYSHNIFAFYKCIIVPILTAIILNNLQLKVSKPAIIIISIVYIKLIIYWFVSLSTI